jgi:hypothetical protein
MALKPCRECKEMVSTEAKACPHCGASDPTGVQKQAHQRGAIGCLSILVVIAVVVAIASSGGSNNSPNTNSPTSTNSSATTSTSASSNGPREALVGNRAVAQLGPVLACPEWEDYKKVVADIVNHDKVGQAQDFMRGDCTVIRQGDTALVIGAGFTSVRVRLDKDQTAYWTESMFGDPMRPLFVCVAGSKCGP